MWWYIAFEHLSSSQGSDVLAKYVALYGAELLRSNAPFNALQLFNSHGASPNPQNFNMYKRLCLDLFAERLEGQTAYSTYSMLRNMLFNLVNCYNSLSLSLSSYLTDLSWLYNFLLPYFLQSSLPSGRSSKSLK